MKLSDLLKDCRIEKMIGDEGVEIAGLTISSETVKKGDLFFCIDGERYDSHALAKEVTAAGAAAFVCEKPVRTSCPQVVVRNVRIAMSRIASAFYGNPSEKLKVIGVTGTNGKTTTVHMLASILEQAGKKVGIVGTLGAEYGGKTLSCGLTTPDPIVLHSILSDMVQAGVEFVLMEVSAHALFYHKVNGIFFTAAIFTNCTRDHLDFFGSMGRYMQAKERLFKKEVCGFAVLNFDDELGRKIAKSGIPFLSYALDNPSEVFAVEIEEELHGVRFVLNLSDELYEINLKLTGRHNVSNAIGAAACARRLGVGMEDIAAGLEKLSSVEGRLEFVGSCNGGDIFVDFAHTPDGLEKSLNALNPHAEGRLICLFGCGGNRDKDKREIMGEIAGQISDLTILTSDNPRYEEPYDIIMDIEQGVRRYTKNYVSVLDRREATEYAIKNLKKGDILLVAGKGGEKFLEVRERKIPYDDKEVIRSLICSMSQI